MFSNKIFLERHFCPAATEESFRTICKSSATNDHVDECSCQTELGISIPIYVDLGHLMCYEN